MGWLILNLFLMLIVMGIYQELISSDKESYPIGLIFGVCFVGFAFFSILGLQTEAIREAVRELLKEMAIIEATTISLGSVAIALRRRGNNVLQRK